MPSTAFFPQKEPPSPHDPPPGQVAPFSGGSLLLKPGPPPSPERILTPSGVVSSSFDPRLPPARLLSGNGKWMTTGTYPQTLTFTFNGDVDVGKVVVVGNGITRLRVTGIGNYERGGAQTSVCATCMSAEECQFDLKLAATGIKGVNVTIESALTDFSTVSNIAFWGHSGPNSRASSQSPNRRRTYWKAV